MMRVPLTATRTNDRQFPVPNRSHSRPSDKSLADGNDRTRVPRFITIGAPVKSKAYVSAEASMLSDTGNILQLASTTHEPVRLAGPLRIAARHVRRALLSNLLPAPPRAIGSAHRLMRMCHPDRSRLRRWLAAVLSDFFFPVTIQPLRPPLRQCGTGTPPQLACCMLDGYAMAGLAMPSRQSSTSPAE